MGCLRIDLLPQVGKKSDDLGATIVAISSTSGFMPADGATPECRSGGREFAREPAEYFAKAGVIGEGNRSC